MTEEEKNGYNKWVRENPSRAKSAEPRLQSTATPADEKKERRKKKRQEKKLAAKNGQARPNPKEKAKAQPKGKATPAAPAFCRKYEHGECVETGPCPDGKIHCVKERNRIADICAKSIATGVPVVSVIPKAKASAP